MTEELQEKYQKLKEYIKDFGKVAVAYSSGVDSTFLLRACIEALGCENVIAITARSSAFPVREYEESVDFCKEQGVKHLILSFDEMSVEGFSENPSNRCYLCKKSLFSEIIRLAKKEGFDTVMEGSNLDDNGDYRPGLHAVAELLVKSPLRFTNFTKAQIRALSKELGLITWKKPSFACLATRFPYGEQITKEKLFMVEQAEDLLMELGFKQYRVRIHGLIARIEVLENEIHRFADDDIRKQIVQKLKEYGFSYVSLDLSGYRTGSMNETLDQEILQESMNVKLSR